MDIPLSSTIFKILIYAIKNYADYGLQIFWRSISIVKVIATIDE